MRLVYFVVAGVGLYATGALVLVAGLLRSAKTDAPLLPVEAIDIDETCSRQNSVASVVPLGSAS